MPTRKRIEQQILHHALALKSSSRRQYQDDGPGLSDMSEEVEDDDDVFNNKEYYCKILDEKEN